MTVALETAVTTVRTVVVKCNVLVKFSRGNGGRGSGDGVAGAGGSERRVVGTITRVTDVFQGGREVERMGGREGGEVGTRGGSDGVAVGRAGGDAAVGTDGISEETGGIKLVGRTEDKLVGRAGETEETKLVGDIGGSDGSELGIIGDRSEVERTGGEATVGSNVTPVITDGTMLEGNTVDTGGSGGG